MEPPPRRFLQTLGPGLITGASDDDPSGIATYSQVGAQFGFSVLWTMLFSYPLMTAIQEISARVGRVTGRGIAANLRHYYPRWLLFPVIALLLIANTLNLGADIGAMGEALRLLVGGPASLYAAVFAVGSLLLEIFLSYKSLRQVAQVVVPGALCLRGRHPSRSRSRGGKRCAEPSCRTSRSTPNI